ncbi:AzlD domain-containing protein [Lapidilactobacillus luobeiensis]|uniref:AzlD domain-containing protein n=1 Tax=Lapidilactobacillus luobeiensis TaxID=2950371 RepID=UPI0021C35BE7|nr:AzlD domain-containing protein [Lapidilactobacillus luobeiensis]
MSSFEYTLVTIIGCGLITWLSRVLPFILLKKFTLSDRVLEFLSFVPIVIMSALWFSNLFTQDLGHLPRLNLENFLASVPTLISAIISKNLLVIVAVGIVSLAVIRVILA